MFKKKSKKPFVSAVIAASGKSERMQGEDKLMLEISDIPVFIHTLLAYEKCEAVDEIVLVCKSQQLVDFANIASAFNITKLAQVVKGGEKRAVSVYNGLKAVSDSAEYVAVHDAARPCITPQEIEDVCNASYKASCAIAAMPIADTVKAMDGKHVLETLDRSTLCRAACPQVGDKSLLYAAIKNALENDIEVSDEAMAMEIIGAKPQIVFCSGQNIKITVPDDIIIAEAIIESRMAV